MKNWMVAAAVGASALGTAAAAADPTPSNALVNAVVGCKAETDEPARLRCYDAAVAALSQAAASGSFVVVDREDVRKTRRSLFGFSLPKLPFFTGDDSQSEQGEEIEAKIRSARGLGYDKWRIVLDSGAVWQTTEGSRNQKPPAAGETIKIKKASMGSYFLAIEGRRSIRGLRVG
jgi:hypothetical protein